MWGKVRIGIIGCGGIAGYHIQGYFNNPDVSLVAFCDVREENVSSQVSEFGGRGYPDYRSMLEKEKLDGVSICTPPSSHQQIAIESMKRGVNVFCEKPLASTVNDAVSMASIDLGVAISGRRYLLACKRSEPPCPHLFYISLI